MSTTTKKGSNLFIFANRFQSEQRQSSKMSQAIIDMDPGKSLQDTFSNPH